MSTLFCKVGKHRSHLAKHLRRHGHKYAGGMFAGFALVKTFVLLAGFVGTFSLLQGHASANFVDPATTCAGVTEIPESECIALLNLYNSTDGDNRTDHSNWGDTGSICGSWTGIVCNANHVSQIELSENNLSGSADFSAFTGLFEIRLYNNHIFNVDLSGLNNLVRLDLTHNELSSINLSSLSHVTQLDLSSNWFSSIDLSGMNSLQIINLNNNILTTLSESIMSLTNLDEGFSSIYYNCLNTGSMSSDLIIFLNDETYGDGRQTTRNPFCPVLGGLNISSKIIDPVIADGSILRYRVSYNNNGTTDSDHTQITIKMPSEMGFLSSTIPYTTIETGLDAVLYGETGDVCYTQFLNETGEYMDVMNQRAQEAGAPDLYTALLNYPDVDVRDSFLGPPYNGQFSMVGEFFFGLLKSAGMSFSDFADKEDIDLSTLPGCGGGQKTKYTRDLGTLSAGSGGEIMLVTQAQNPTSDTTALDTILPKRTVDGIPSPSTLQLPNDPDTKNHPIAISYTNASDQGVSFRPNNPAYPGTYSNAEILSGIIQPDMSDQEKVIALWQFVKDTTANYPIGDTSKGSQWYVFGNVWNIHDYQNPVYFLNSLNGMCGEINGTFAQLAKLAGFDARLRQLNGHVVPEIYVDSGRAMLDADGGVYRTGEDGHIYSMAELAENTNIMRNNVQDNNYPSEVYIDMIANTGFNTIWGLQDIALQETSKNVFVFLHPNDSIKYEYSNIYSESVNNGQINDGDGIITHRLANNQYTNISGEDFGVTGQTETGFIYADEVPYLVTTMDISLTTPTDKIITTSISTDGGAHWRPTGLLNQRIGYILNPSDRADDAHNYLLKFDCTDCTQDDITNIIPQITIKDNFIFNTKILPYTGQLNIYASTLDTASGVITVNYNTDTENTYRFTTNIMGDVNELDGLDNTQVVDMFPWVNFAPVLLPNSDLTQFAGQVFLWKGYTHDTTSLFTDLPDDTLIGTSAISFLNTDTIPQNIVIRGDNVETFLPADTIVTETGASCDEKILLAPQDVTDQFIGATKAFKIGSPCTGTSLDFSHDIRIRAHTDQTLGDIITFQTSSDGDTRANISGTKIDAHTIEITTDHFSFFKITSDTPSDTGGATNGAGAGGTALIKDQCPAQRDCTSSYYDQLCGPCPTTATGMIHGSATGYVVNSPYSTELTQAYQRAFTKGITTIPSIQQANMDGKIIRDQMAKMITQFAIKVLNKKPDTTLACTFADIKNESAEMQFYIKTACQLGLMGRASDGKTTQSSFAPSATITRAQFATILSRLLYGNKYNTADAINRASKHLQALNKAGIITNISRPNMEEIRGYVMLMLMRSALK